METVVSPRPQLMRYQFNTLAELHAAYMPFIKGGGLFIKTFSAFSLGDTVALELTLPTQPSLSLTGTVIWITPLAAQGGKAAGIGLQFSGAAQLIFQDKVVGLLAGLPPLMNSDTL